MTERWFHQGSPVLKATTKTRRNTKNTKKTKTKHENTKHTKDTKDRRRKTEDMKNTEQHNNFAKKVFFVIFLELRVFVVAFETAEQ